MALHWLFLVSYFMWVCGWEMKNKNLLVLVMLSRKRRLLVGIYLLY